MKVLILAGGGGTRLWPLSRSQWPKQFFNFSQAESSASLLSDTVTRCLNDSINLTDVYIITGQGLLDQVTGELQRAGLSHVIPNIICEPMRRNTAGAIALGAAFIEETSTLADDEVIAILPADHYFQDNAVFLADLEKAQVLAREGYIVTLGIEPSSPETGFGYIEIAERGASRHWYPVRRFVEKPDYDTALHYVASQRYFWNAGIFVMTLQTLRQSFQTHAPQIASIVSKGYEHAYRHFHEMPDISIDYAIMERAENIAVVPMASGWCDMGSWDNVFDVLDKDANGNVVYAESAQTIDTQNSLIFSKSNRFVATIGLENCMIIDTPDALLVARQGETQRVREIVSELEQTRRDLAVIPSTRVHPWGEVTRMQSPAMNGQDELVYYVTFYPNHRLTIQVASETRWCVMGGSARLELQNRPLQSDSMWLQPAVVEDILSVSSDGLRAMIIGEQPDVSLPHALAPVSEGVA